MESQKWFILIVNKVAKLEIQILINIFIRKNKKSRG